MEITTTGLCDAFGREIFIGDILAVSSDYRVDLLPMEVISKGEETVPTLILARCDGEKGMASCTVSEFSGFYLYGHTTEREPRSTVVIRAVDGREFMPFTPGHI